eukprot:CAMPEP_0204591406 /NCGR_PEP_ID=MMETSP0661-20131031/50341_1 /ASSEMBLY_ACC=CAM_ASM_000606 /TAXON_ID=109239 /ORGANISM="Alexandrium margalefi, Strain AMGDE01CS-322" /LENGTH=202 /DNA_ID=CAMNT_0051601529 /DNA_START=276 /DNA_END=884 /DNA_ORIENTATION=-
MSAERVGRLYHADTIAQVLDSRNFAHFEAMPNKDQINGPPALGICLLQRRCQSLRCESDEIAAKHDVLLQDQGPLPVRAPQESLPDGNMSHAAANLFGKGLPLEDPVPRCQVAVVVHTRRPCPHQAEGAEVGTAHWLAMEDPPAGGPQGAPQSRRGLGRTNVVDAEGGTLASIHLGHRLWVICGHPIWGRASGFDDCSEAAV